jgi:drug/metabolite transporter (DMT)-like permease
MPFLGPLAALGTSVLWSFTSTFFSLAGRRVGSMVVNRIRLVLAVIFLMLTHWVLLGAPLPTNATPERWFWLGLSGIIGLIIGDALLFQCFVWLGPRLSMLLMSLVPVIGAALAWLFLDETLSALQMVAVTMTLAGVSSVILDRAGNNAAIVQGKRYGVGIMLGVGGAVGQAVGLITAKQGLAHGFSVLSGTLMRMIVAMVVLWLLTIGSRQGQETVRRVWQDRRALWQLLAGAFVGPFLGVYLSLVAVQLAPVGIASTLMSLPPVFLLPISHFVFGERIGARAIAGTLLAIAGVAMLMLV